LFEASRPRLDRVFDASFSTARRVQLDPHSWVEHVPGWLAAHEQLKEELLEQAAWAQHDRWMINRFVREPRLTATYPVLAEAPILLRQIGEALTNQYGVTYDGLWLNWYRDHRDSTSWHGDWPSCKRDSCVVPVLSLGAPRHFLIRPRTGGRSTSFTPEGGDLIIMGGQCQKDWLHAVPKQARPASLRLSVNFMSSWQARR
jgi:alkylated DNA repair dioxygenase AlkB